MYVREQHGEARGADVYCKQVAKTTARKLLIPDVGLGCELYISVRTKLKGIRKPRSVGEHTMLMMKNLGAMGASRMARFALGLLIVAAATWLTTSSAEAAVEKKRILRAAELLGRDERRSMKDQVDSTSTQDRREAVTKERTCIKVAGCHPFYMNLCRKEEFTARGQ